MNIYHYPILKKKYTLRQFQIDDQDRIVIYGLYDRIRVDLNSDSQFVVKHFTGQHSLRDIISKVSTQYEIPVGEAIEAIEPIVTDLKKKDMIYFSDEPKAVRNFPPLKKVRGVLDQVYIRLTNACNFNCKHCSVDARHRWPDELSETQYLDLIDQIHELMVPTVIFTGGEPTLLKGLPAFIKHASAKPIRTSLMTNGFNITQAYAEALVGNGLAHVNISIDGGTDETHDGFRRTKGAFGKAVKAIEIFRQLGTRVETTTVVHRDNAGEINDILNLGEKYELFNMKFLPIVPYERGKTCDYNESLSIYLNVMGTFIDKFDRKIYKKDLTEKMSTEKLYKCNAGEGVLAVKPNGDVLPCNNLNDIIIGNVKHQSLYEIYNSSPQLADVEAVIQIQGSECESCPILDYCHGGCAMVSFSYKGDYHSCDVIRKNEVLELRKRQCL